MADNQVTKDLFIVFADLSGSTKLYDRLGNTEAHGLVGQVVSDLCNIVDEHGGTVIKTIGDEILATFENGVAVVESVFYMHKFLELSAVTSGQKSNFRIRVGFHQGPVILENGDVFGNAVNLAARIVALAKAGQILTTKETLDLLGDEVAALARQTDVVRLKGLSGEFAIFELIPPETQQTVTMALGDFTVTGSNAPQQRLELTLHGQKIHVDTARPQVGFGRAVDNDIVVASQTASRFHGKIDFKRDKFVLTDQSYNGTFVQPDGKDVILVRHDEQILEGRGRIFLGHKNASDVENTIFYQVQ